MSEHNAPAVVLVAFYNKKALGVRYLQAALEQAGYRVRTVFYKDFNSVRPTPTTELELEFLRRVVREADPVLVGLSVMSSMYLDTVYQVLDAALDASPAPVVCGGAFATMFPQRMLERGASFVLRADGEDNLCRLANALRNGLAEKTRFACGDASALAARLEAEGIRPDVVVVDPPRKGLAPDVADTIARMAPERVVYVSCDPATLARDIARFSPLGYRAVRAEAVDLFPRTSHVETVCLLERGV